MPIRHPRSQRLFWAAAGTAATSITASITVIRIVVSSWAVRVLFQRGQASLEVGQIGRRKLPDIFEQRLALRLIAGELQRRPPVLPRDSRQLGVIVDGNRAHGDEAALDLKSGARAAVANRRGKR